MSSVNSNVSVNWVAGDNIVLTFTQVEGGYLQVEVDASGGGEGEGGGHTIKEAGNALTQRASLNFLAGFDLADDLANNETEVALDASEVSAAPATQAFGDSAVTGTAGTFANSGHKHAMPADPVTAHVAAGDPHTAYRKEADLNDYVAFSLTGTLTTGTGVSRWYNDTGRTITLQSARGSVGVAPTTQSILVDVNINGTSAWAQNQANRITIAAGTNTDEGSTFDDATVADGEYLTIDVDQVGSGTAGSDLTVTIWYTS